MSNKLVALAFALLFGCSSVPRDVEEAFYNIDRLNYNLKPASKRAYVQSNEETEKRGGCCEDFAFYSYDDLKDLYQCRVIKGRNHQGKTHSWLEVFYNSKWHVLDRDDGFLEFEQTGYEREIGVNR